MLSVSILIFIPDLRGENAFSFPCHMILAMEALYIVFVTLIMFPLCHFVESVYCKWMLNFVKVVSASIEMII